MSWDEAQLQSHLDAMAAAISAHFTTQAPLLVGITSGGAWVADALNRKLDTPLPQGTLNAAFYRDDFDTRGLKATVSPSKLPFDIDGQHILLVDDVLMTGRTIRAAMNELFDFGRPASITLAVLFDIGRRQLPIRADICGETLALPPHQRVELRGPSPLVAEIRELVSEDNRETRSHE